jgi:DNA-binding CsgD family transcriptional regulator
LRRFARTGARLNDRQIAILRMLADGKKDKQIADVLKIHEATARAAIVRAVHSLGAKTRCHAVAMFIRQDDDDRSG